MIIHLDFLLSDCPQYWKNFIDGEIKPNYGHKTVAKVLQNNYDAEYIKGNGYNKKSIVKFKSESDLAFFKLKWA